MLPKLQRYTTAIWRPLCHFYHLNYIGLVFGIFAYFASLTPSLLPRSSLYMGIVSGLSFGVGYGIGMLLSHILRWTDIPEPSQKVKQRVWYITLGVGALITIILGFWAAKWQNDVRQLVGEQPLAGSDITQVIIVSFITITIALAIAKGIGHLYNLIRRFIAKIGLIPRRIVSLLAWVLVAVVIVLAFNDVIFHGFKTVANNIYRSSNQRTDKGAVQPTTPLKSGGPSSLVSWNNLGRQGRNFIGKGPNIAQLTTFNHGTPAEQPIRIYAGIESAPTIEQRADLVVRELDRTNAWARKVLVVVTPTGSGWIEPEAPDSLEYMYNGNTAIAALQYSYLPSWIAQLTEQSESTDAGRALFNAIYAKWSSLPLNARPKLITYGLSLGSYGGQSPFSSASDLAARTNGALFLGSPNFSEPWGYFTENRDTDSPEYRPVYQKATVIRFANTQTVLNTYLSRSKTGGVLYLQHGSDPVVWWSPDLIFKKPDWLKEQRATDVSTDTHWFPIVTFLQVTIDQFFATKVPVGYGHNYANLYVSAWQDVTNPAGWSSTDSTRLQQLILSEAQ